jgi:thiol-disulfide isomerase/thioredoxin
MRNILLLFMGIGLAVQTTSAQRLSKVKITQIETRIANPDTFYIVNFWATWCGPCVAELPAFNRIDSAWQGKPVKVLLVSLDFPEAWPGKLTEFLKKKKIGAEVFWLDESDANYFIPKISNQWSGSIPATLFSCKKSGQREFLEKKLTFEELQEKINAGSGK